MKVSMAMSLAIALIPVASCAHNVGPTQPAARADRESSWPDDDSQQVAVRPCTAETTAPAPADGHITPFQGPIITYPVDSSAAPTVAVKGGALHVSVNVPVKAEAQYAGLVLPFPKCTDASAFAGVRFKIRGSYSGCSMEFGTKDVQHEDPTLAARFAAGKRGAYPPQTRLEKSQVAPVAQTVTIPFDAPGMRGNPPLPLDKSNMTGVVWQFTVGMASNIDDGTRACVADLDIDDVVFYR